MFNRNNDNNTDFTDLSKIDYMFKLCFVGNSGVGKTTLLSRYSNNNFTDYYIKTVGLGLELKQLQIGNHICRIQLFEPSESLKEFKQVAYGSSHGIAFVYDITNISSFENIKNKWYMEFSQNRKKFKDSKNKDKYCYGYDYETYTPQVLILGTKSDLRNQSNYNSCVDFNIVREFAQSINAQSFEVSSKDNIGIDELFFETLSALKYNYLKSNGLKFSDLKQNFQSSKCLIN